jgi:hypothetical protein
MKELTIIEKLELVQSTFEAFDADFSKNTVLEAFEIFRELEEVIKNRVNS